MKLNEVTGYVGYDVSGTIMALDDIPAMQQYRNPDASYDDVWYSMPVKVFLKALKLKMADIERINDNTDDYEGSVSMEGDTVVIYGGA